MTAVLTVIAGPTASGKTGLAIEVARLLDAEVVSADSQAVYRGFDLGTAKPTAAEQAEVRHHLVSHVEPMDEYSAARFQRDADRAIAEIAGRGKRVVIAGGTGLYLRVLLHGVVEAPGSDAALRAELEAFAERAGNQALHHRLEAVDPETALRLPIADRVRIVRALEIHALTGKTASAYRREHAFTSDRYEHRLWVIDPPRAHLYARIEARAAAMFRAGLVDEVKRLVEAGYREAPAMGSVGYVQALACLEGRLSLVEAVADTAKKTRHYAKRQWTWFKKEQGARAVAPPVDAKAIAQATRELEAARSK